eukprot:3195753-Pyramimonas_sp.AAC.1
MSEKEIGLKTVGRKQKAAKGCQRLRATGDLHSESPLPAGSVGKDHVRATYDRRDTARPTM